MKIEQLGEAARRTLRVLTWTPSRYAKWKTCPRKVLFEDLMKMCPVCFRGRISGGYDGDPARCDTCDGKQPERGPLDRGNRLDDALTLRVKAKDAEAAVAARVAEGLKDTTPVDVQRAEVDDAIVAHRENFLEATRHPGVLKLVKKLQKAKGVSVQESIVLDSRWNRVGQFTKNAWARLKLDVLVLKPKSAQVLDWKSGNIDSRTGEIREKDEYHDSMRAYQMAVLSVFPQAECSAEMVFLDTPPKAEVFTKSLPVLKRKDLDSERLRWEEKISTMLKDDQFAPRPGYYCTYCDFSKKKGGPCPY